jgi:hypothetical protein
MVAVAFCTRVRLPLLPQIPWVLALSAAVEPASSTIATFVTSAKTGLLRTMGMATASSQGIAQQLQLPPCPWWQCRLQEQYHWLQRKLKA